MKIHGKELATIGSTCQILVQQMPPLSYEEIGKAIVAEAAKILLQPPKDDERDEVYSDSASISVVQEILANRLKAVTEPEVDPAVEAVKAELNKWRAANGAGFADVMGEKIISEIVAAVRKSDGERHGG